MFAQDYCGLPSIVNLQGCSLLSSGCSLYSSGVHKGPLRAISPRAGGCHHLRPPCWGPQRRRGEAALDCARSRGGGDPGSRCPVQAGAGEGTAVLGALPGLRPRSPGRQRAARSGLPGRARVRTAGVGVEGVVVARVASGFHRAGHVPVLPQVAPGWLRSPRLRSGCPVCAGKMETHTETESWLQADVAAGAASLISGGLAAWGEIRFYLGGGGPCL